MSWHNLVNTTYFCEAANDYRKNNGAYTRAPRGSREYTEYWEMHENRCKKGYSVGGVWIPGRYYDYLNFSPIWKVDDKIALKAYEEQRNHRGQVGKRTADKILDFPRFIEMQYEWYKFKHIAWYGGTFMGIHCPGAKHIVAAKARGAGFSYMEAQDGVYNFKFIDGSKSYYFAASEQYLIKDGILTKAAALLDWTNVNIPYWRQNRMENNTLMHQTASYIDAGGEKRGSRSEIIGTIVDKPDKTRGKRGRKIVFEEAGSFPRLKKALEVCLGSAADGDFQVGQISVFGTGGEEGPGIEGLEDIFYHPEAYGMMEFPNIWENGTSDTCGYYVPAYRCNFLYHDLQGNCDIEAAIVSDEAARNKKRKSGDPKQLDARIAEYSRTPAEAFQRLSSSGFNKEQVRAQIRYIESSNAIQGMLRHGQLIRSNTENAIGGVEFIIQDKEKAKPIEHFPHKNDDDLTGCVTIVSRPYIDNSHNVPAGMYQIVFDAYYKDEAEDRTSLFDITVWKLANNIDNEGYDTPQAWYTGRPQSVATCHEILFMLCDMYNCSANGEIMGGGADVLAYAKRYRLLHRLDFEPEMLHNKELESSQKNRSYLMNMTTDRKKQGMLYMEEWAREVRGATDKGHLINNVQRCYKIGMLREMLKAWSINTDRLSSGIIYQYMRKEKIAEVAASIEEESGFYDRQLFETEGVTTETGIISMY